MALFDLLTCFMVPVITTSAKLLSLGKSESNIGWALLACTCMVCTIGV